MKKKCSCPQCVKDGEQKCVNELVDDYNWGVGNLKRRGLKNAPEETKNYIRKYLGSQVDEAVLDEEQVVVKNPEDKLRDFFLTVDWSLGYYNANFLAEEYGLDVKDVLRIAQELDLITQTSPYERDIIIHAPKKDVDPISGVYKKVLKAYGNGFGEVEEAKSTPDTMQLLLSNTDKYALIDKEDYPKVKDYSWFLKKDKRTNVEYVAASKREGPKVKTIRLHRLIMDARPDEDVHHKDLNVLNNAKENLELLPKAEHRARHQGAPKPIGHHYEN